ncbi:MAG: hypothetical protein RL368_2571 [Pseudomonadota bacterium]|jgi:sortase A
MAKHTLRTFSRLSWIVIGALLMMIVWNSSHGKSLYSPQAWVAHGLLHTAWVRTQASGRQVKPWPWANTYPLARLSIPQLNFERVILARASEGVSSYALGHLDSSAIPGELGNSILSVHPDTDLRILQNLHVGDLLVLESLRSGLWRYKVSDIQVVEKSNMQLLTPIMNRRLTLISCYSCTSERDLWRYVIVAEEVERVG